jgi:hypothetical protein
VSRKPRVFLGNLDFQGYLSCIATAVGENGADAFVLNLGANAMGHFVHKKESAIVRIFMFVREFFLKTRTLSKFNPIRYFVSGSFLIATWGLIFWICLRFDVIYLKGGEGFSTRGRDVRLFRALGKTLIAHFAGSDSRPPYLNGNLGEKANATELADYTRKIYDSVEKIQDRFDYIIDNPLASHFHQRPCVIGQCLGTNVDFGWINEFYIPIVKRPKGGPVRILHAPSMADLKGTTLICDAISTLQQEGLPIEYVQIEKQPNTVVLREIANSDIIVDELYSDTPGATFAVEAAILERPVIVGSYGKRELERFLPEEAILPSCLIEPGELVPALRSLVLSDERRLAAGQRLRAFALEWFSPAAFGRRFLDIAEGRAPADWFFDPRDISYVRGVAGPDVSVRKGIRKLLAAAGPDGLCLDDKPQLRTMLCEFVNGESENEKFEVAES